MTFNRGLLIPIIRGIINPRFSIEWKETNMTKVYCLLFNSNVKFKEGPDDMKQVLGDLQEKLIARLVIHGSPTFSHCYDHQLPKIE